MKVIEVKVWHIFAIFVSIILSPLLIICLIIYIVDIVVDKINLHKTLFEIKIKEKKK